MGSYIRIALIPIILITFLIAGCFHDEDDEDTLGDLGDLGGSDINQVTAAAYVEEMFAFAEVLDIGSGVVSGVLPVDVQTVDGDQNAGLGALLGWTISTVITAPFDVTPNTVVAIIPDDDIPCGESQADGNVSVSWNDANNDNMVSQGDTADVNFIGCVGLFDSEEINGAVTIDIVAMTGDWITPEPPLSIQADVGFTNLEFLFGGGDQESISGDLLVGIGTQDLLEINTSIGGAFSGTGTEDGESYNYSYSNLDLSSIFNDSIGTYSEAYNGNVTDSDLGSFQVITAIPFAGFGTEFPSTGNGTAIAEDNSTVTLNVLDNVNIELIIDTDGIPPAETTVPLTWDDLD